MTRVSTAGSYQSALLNLMAAQSQQADAQARVTTQKIATDLSGFGRGSESLTSFKSAQARIQGFIDTGESVAARLEAQDLALSQVDLAVGDVRTAVANAIATESSVTLMLDISNQFQAMQGALNTRHRGTFLFSGSRADTAPVTVQSLTELTAAPSAASAFANDQLAALSRLSEGPPLKTGILADEVGSTVFQIFREIQAYNDDPATGPLTGRLTQDQKAFLTAQLSRLDDAKVEVVSIAANNGSLANQVETLNNANAAQVQSLEALVGKRTDADLAQAITDLRMSELAIQASAQVVSRLSEVTLLNFLR